MRIKELMELKGWKAKDLAIATGISDDQARNYKCSNNEVLELKNGDYVIINKQTKIIRAN